MFYTNFDNNITDKYGIIVKNWPLPVFCAPGDIRTFTELKILYNAWESGAAHFHRITLAEATKRSNDRFSKSIAETSGPGGTLASISGSENVDPDPDASAINASDISGSEYVDPTVSEQINSRNATAVNASEQVPEQVNPNLTDPAISEQTIVNASVLDPSHAPNLSPTSPSVGATGSGVKRAQATEPQPQPPSKRHHQALTPAFINTVVTSVDGAAVVMNRKARKQRSDKGKKRVK
jgi:hypothetical protein